MKEELDIEARRGLIFRERSVVFKDRSKYDRNNVKDSFRKELMNY